MHLLPAPIFRMTANLQARRRIGLTATLVREDGREGDVFSLIGPKRYDAPWKDIEAQGWIAPADCVEVRVTMPASPSGWPTPPPSPRSATGWRRARHAKTGVAEQLVDQHAGEPTLVIGQYLDQLDELGRRPRRAGHQGRDAGQGAPAALRGVPHGRDQPAGRLQGRQLLHRPARGGGGDPGARARFGSRQEEAQRLGRLLRPKADGRTARFYAIVARDSVDADFAQNRQRFLAEQGYAYRITDADDLLT